MDFSKIIIIIISSIVLYLSFLFFGLKLRNKNIAAQKLTKKNKF